MKRDDFNVRIDEVRELATKYSKSDLQRMVQMGVVEPQKAVMAGMMIDRIAKSAMQPPTSTVAQDVLGMAPTSAGMPQQMGQEQMPQEQMPQEQMQPPMMAAGGGIMGALPYSDGVAALPTNIPDYAGGGIIAFADRGAVKDPYKVERPELESFAVPEERTPQSEMERSAQLQQAFGFKPGEFFSQRATEATKEREKLKSREDDSARKAFIKGSLAAAAGKSRYALQNIAEGAVKGYESYEGEQKDIRDQERLLREADRKDAEAQFLHKRGEVDAAGKRIEEGQKLRMEAQAKNIEAKNKAASEYAKSKTEMGKTGFEQVSATGRTAMEINARKEIANLPSDQQKLISAIQKSEAEKNPDNPPSPLEIYQMMHSGSKAEIRAKTAMALEKEWNDMSIIEKQKLLEANPGLTSDKYIEQKMKSFDQYFAKPQTRSTTTTATSTVSNALPMPPNQSGLQKGAVYNTARGPATWNGTAFVPVQ